MIIALNRTLRFDANQTILATARPSRNLSLIQIICPGRPCTKLTTVATIAATMHLTIKTLESDHAARAFPLIQAHDPRATLDQWQRYVRALADPDTVTTGTEPGGAIVATDTLGYIHGLFTYRVAPNLIAGRSLVIEHFVPFEGLTTHGVANILLLEIEPLARRLSCHSVAIDVPARDLPVAEPTHPALPLLGATGHRLDTARLVRAL